MTKETKKFDLKETTEVFDFCNGTLEDLYKHKTDDGKIDIGEWVETATTNAPAAVKAYVGIDKVDNELLDLDDEEIKKLAIMGGTLLKNLAILLLAGFKK